MFELESMTKVKVLDVRVLARKDRKPEEAPGAQMLLRATLAADALSCFDGFLSAMLYRKADGPKQSALDGLEPVTLTAIGSHVQRMPWLYEQTGCTVVIDRGMGGRRSNLELTDCKVHRVLIAPRDGGSVVLQWTVDAPGVSDDVRGKLTGLKATEVELTIAGPDPADEPQTDLTREPTAA